MGPSQRRADPQAPLRYATEHGPYHATRHALSRATFLALPLVLLLSNAAELILIGVLAFLFFFLVLILQGLEERANARGGSLLRSRQPRPGDRVDRALGDALNWLGAGEGPGFVVRGLGRVTDGGLLLRGEARRSYWLAIECLERTEQGDQVLGWRDRWRDLEEGRVWLEAAREAYVGEVVR